MGLWNRIFGHHRERAQRPLKDRLRDALLSAGVPGYGLYSQRKDVGELGKYGGQALLGYSSSVLQPGYPKQEFEAELSERHPEWSQREMEAYGPYMYKLPAFNDVPEWSKTYQKYGAFGQKAPEEYKEQLKKGAYRGVGQIGEMGVEAFMGGEARPIKGAAKAGLKGLIKKVGAGEVARRYATRGAIGGAKYGYPLGVSQAMKEEVPFKEAVTERGPEMAATIGGLGMVGEPAMALGGHKVGQMISRLGQKRGADQRTSRALGTYFEAEKPLGEPVSEQIAGVQSRIKSREISPVKKFESLISAEKQGKQAKVIEAPQQDSAVKRVVGALRAAEPIRGTQEKIYSAERAQKLAKMVAVGKKVEGEKGFYAELGQLKGKMGRAQYKSIRGKINQEDINKLFEIAKNADQLNPFETVSARKGLAKLFGEAGGKVPTNKELDLLHEVFGPELTNVVLAKRPLMDKFKEGGHEVANISRSLMASYDLSFPFRQGAFMIRRQKEFAPAFGSMFKQFGSERAFKEVQTEIARRPSYKLMRSSGLSLTELGQRMSKREEGMMSTWAEKIPLVGLGVRASNRAYTGFANKLRADVFDSFVKQSKKLGIPQDPDFLKSAATYINNATGRGGLGKLENSAVALNSAIFSPRLVASRINLMNPNFYVKLHPKVRKEALKDLFTFAGLALTTASLAKMGGASVETNPISSDFAKIKVGNTRYDPLAGFQQYIVLAARLITKKTKSSTTGKVTRLGEKYGGPTRLSTAYRFIENKQSPAMSFVTTFLKGKTASGEKLKLSDEVASRFVPMMMQDMYDLYKEEGAEGIPLVTPAIFGIGVQTYGKRKASSDLPTLNEARQQGRDIRIIGEEGTERRDSSSPTLQELERQGREIRIIK